MNRDVVQVDADAGTEMGGATVKRRFDLAKISQWCKDGRYARLQQLQDDLLAVFRAGRTEYESEMYHDSFKLERTYLKVRDEVCMGGALLWSPALEYTTKYVYTVVCEPTTKGFPLACTCSSKIGSLLNYSLWV